MKSKETIRHQILHHGKLIWGARNIDQMDPLVSLLVDVLAQELFLIQNNVNDIDQLLLEKLASLLTPDTYAFVRPAHAILQITPTRPFFDIDNKSEFYLKDLPQHFQTMGVTLVTFSPVTPVRLTNVAITHLFHGNTLFELNVFGEKKEIVKAFRDSEYTTIWLGLEVNDKVKDLENLYFYFDFPHLHENHEYYDLLPYTHWRTGEKEISVKQGMSPAFENTIQDHDKSVMRFYHNHYLSIDRPLPLSCLPEESLPVALKNSVHEEQLKAIPLKRWIQISFPPNFSPEDLMRMTISLNAFPVSNKRLCEQRFSKNALQGMPLLPAESGEKFLTEERIWDTEENSYHRATSDRNSRTGTYHLEIIKAGEGDEHGAVFNYLERLIDIAQEERIRLPGIDTEKMNDMVQSLNQLQEEITVKLQYNRKSKQQEIAKIRIYPYPQTSNVHVRYWVTGGTIMNGIPKGSVLMAQKNSPLDKENTILLTTSCGAREFSEITDMMAVNKYLLTSNDRIITSDNIVDFCKSELGKLLKQVHVNRQVVISPKPKEGLVSVIIVKLLPSEDYPGLLHMKGLLRDLKVRLQQRSPGHYNYRILIDHEANKSDTIIKS